MTIFRDAALVASGAVDTVFGELWDYAPMRSDDDNARGSPDPDRAPLTITGAYIDPSMRAFGGPTRTAGVRAEHPGHASARPALNLDFTQLPFAPRHGDRVTRQETGETFKIAESRPDKTGPRGDLDLNLLSRKS